MLRPEFFELCDSSLPLLSPPFGIWKIPPLCPEGGLADGFVGGRTGPGFWEGTGPFGTCGVTLGIVCDSLTWVRLRALVVVEEVVVEEVVLEAPGEAEGLSFHLSFL
jgi:hypothetical protein